MGWSWRDELRGDVVCSVLYTCDFLSEFCVIHIFHF